MSHINFDFLTESFLFGYGLEDNFSALSDYELEKELNRYREYVISNMGEICREIIFDSRKIAVTIESFSERPREELLKQLALYVDVVTISDPLFELTEKKSNSTKVMAEYYGMNSDNTIDREQLVAALKYMKESTILVVCNYVKYIPISYLHEAPMNVPITYDANNYSKFDQSDRESFLQQTQILVDKGFLNSFLVLSLLINIYKAERELPENKLELYQKCFEYISNKREKEKSQEKYDWALISTLMKDNTFMELANLCLPNNSDVSKDIIKERLTQIYKTKYVSENQTELAIDQFLIFCSDRTELFVPASGEDCFKFFHRSFFEYFYSQYIFTRMSSVEEIYDAWRTFDVDSEIFELTLAMFKQKNESKYQEIVEFLLEKLEKAFSNNIERINVMNMLVLCMQVIDDELYKKQFVNFIVDNVEFCNKNIQKIHNQGFIINVINSNNDYKDMVINRYGDIAIYESVIAFLKVYPEAEQFLKQNSKCSDFNQQVEVFKFRFEHFYNFNFYSQMYFSSIAINKVFENLSSTDIVTLGKKTGATTKEINKTQAKYKKYLALKPEIKENVDKLLLQR